MKKIKVNFDTWVQLLGMLGVLSGLVFVGLEMRQSQQIALAAQQQAQLQIAALLEAAKPVAAPQDQSKVAAPEAVATKAMELDDPALADKIIAELSLDTFEASGHDPSVVAKRAVEAVLASASKHRKTV